YSCTDDVPGDECRPAGPFLASTIRDERCPRAWSPGDNSTCEPAEGRSMIPTPLAFRQPRRRVFMSLVRVVISLWSCASATANVTVTDDTGHVITLPSTPTRIVSLAPGATEMLFAAGAGPHLLATVEYSDEPAAARQVPRIGDVVAVDMEKLVALRPEVAVVWPGGGNPAQIEEIGRMGIPLYRQQVNTLADLPGSLRRLGALTGTTDVAEQAARSLEARLASLAHRYNNQRHPTVLLQVWNHPIYTVGGTHIMSDALRLCGARNVFGDL